MSAETEKWVHLRLVSSTSWPAVTSHVDALDIFRTACDIFQRELSEEEKRLFAQCPDAESMINSIKHELKSHSVNGNKLTTYFKRIEKLSKKLVPFFDIVTICVQSTAYAAWAWGAIRLLCQVNIVQIFAHFLTLRSSAITIRLISTNWPKCLKKWRNIFLLMTSMSQAFALELPERDTNLTLD